MNDCKWKNKRRYNSYQKKQLQQKTLVHSVTYSKADGAYKNGKTLHVTEDGDIFESDPTPGSITPPLTPQEEEPAEDDEDEENLEELKSSNIPKVQNRAL